MKFFRQPYLLNIDLLGVCNLKCPSCPTGRRENGIVKATFSSLTLHSCTTSATCTVSGTIETTAQGVFD